MENINDEQSRRDLWQWFAIYEKSTRQLQGILVQVPCNDKIEEQVNPLCLFLNFYSEYLVNTLIRA